MSKHELAIVPEIETSNGAELRDATFASLEGRACTEAAQALTEAVNELVLHQLARAEATGAAKTNRKKLKPAIAAFLADLFGTRVGLSVTEEGRLHRSSWRPCLSSPPTSYKRTGPCGVSGRCR